MVFVNFSLLRASVAFIAIFIFINIIINETIQLQSSSQRNNNNTNTEPADFLTADSNISSRRKLQFESMFDNSVGAGGTKKRRGSRGGTGGGRQRRVAPAPMLQNSATSKLKISAEAITVDAPRYHLWWTGPPNNEAADSPSTSSLSRPAAWGARHNLTSGNPAIFTMAVVQGLRKGDTQAFSRTARNLLVYLATARRVFQGDIVVALEADGEGLNAELQEILRRYRAVVYVLPSDLCSKATESIFCGSAEERVPASVFRFYFFELWAALYSDTSLILISDFKDVFFQADPFAFKSNHWMPDYHLAVFKEFHPNMVIERCRFNRPIMSECFGDEALRSLGHHTIVSSGATMGTRDAILVWSRHMTLLLQDAAGRQVEGRCQGGGIEHAFINWLVYGNKLRQLGVRIKLFSQGEGAVNSVGGLQPDTVGGPDPDPGSTTVTTTTTTTAAAAAAAITIAGPIKKFWKIFSDSGYVLNWNGEVSPVVHQLDHFRGELLAIADELVSARGNKERDPDPDRWWQAVAAARCLWGCSSSPSFPTLRE